MLSPIGHTDRQLASIFSSIFYSNSGVEKIYENLRGAHIQPHSFFDPQFLQNYAYRTENQTTMFLDFGGEYTSASIWTKRGPVWHTKINIGGTEISKRIASALNLDFDSADRIKRNVSSLIPKEMDRFTPAETAYDF